MEMYVNISLISTQTQLANVCKCMRACAVKYYLLSTYLHRVSSLTDALL